MAEIKASQVRELRDLTGAGMMECKAALVEANGDVGEAVKVLRKKGLAAAGKKAGRITSEGIVVAVDSGGTGVLVEVNCETDFVAQTDEFRELAEGIARIVAEARPSTVDELNRLPWPGDPEGHDVAQFVATKIAKIGENIAVRRFVGYERGDGGVFGTYVHGKGSIGVLVEMKVEGGHPKTWNELAREIAMHVAASDPRFIHRREVTPEVLEAEREIAREQAAKSGKPENVIEKIVAGKMEKFFGEAVLTEQPWVRDDKNRVGQVVAACASEAGGRAEIVRFTRFKLGEGLEKRSADFVAEVMAQAGR